MLTGNVSTAVIIHVSQAKLLLRVGPLETCMPICFNLSIFTRSCAFEKKIARPLKVKGRILASERSATTSERSFANHSIESSRDITPQEEDD